MAIARAAADAATGTTAAAFTLTISYDAGAGDDRFLIVALQAPNDTITGVTYNAVPMTLLDKTTATQPFVYIYGLPDPAPGTNDVIITNANFNFMQAVVKGYTGVDDSTTPDSVSASTDNATFALSLSMSTTTVADNAWTFYAVVCANTASTAVAGTGSNLVGQRLSATNGSINLFDSNAAHTPAGAESMQATHGSNTNWRGVLVSLAPETEVGGGAALSKLTLLGVG